MEHERCCKRARERRRGLYTSVGVVVMLHSWYMLFCVFNLLCQVCWGDHLFVSSFFAFTVVLYTDTNDEKSAQKDHGPKHATDQVQYCGCFVVFAL